MKIRRLITFAISAILLAGVVSANAAQPLQIDRSTRPAEPSFGFSITDDNFSGYGAYSSISGAKRGGFTTNVECTSVSDPKCAEADNLRVSVIVPPCPANYDATDVCIKSLRTADSTGTLQNATLQYEAETNKFPKDLANQLPAGGGGSVWRGASAKGGTLDYAVVVDLQINWYRTAQPGTQKWVVGYSAQVIPVKIKSGNYYPVYWKYWDSPNSGKVISSEPQLPAGVTSYDPWFDCVIVDKGRCALADTFHADQKIELALQMDNTVAGWMFGRMKDTKVSSVPISKDSSLLTVEGASINVPFGHAWVPIKEIPTGTPSLQEFARLQKIIGNDITSEWFNWGRPSNHQDLFQFSETGLLGGERFIPSPTVAGVGMFVGIEPWLKTISTTPTWRFQGMSPSSFWGMDQTSANKVWGCTVNDKTKLHGLMTTNAMAYSWSPPALKDEFLSYKVAGAHLDADGSVYKGTYNLSMNAESAKCIYGFTDAPIQATVSISKEGGETTNVATELLSIQNGWMNLSANNFTFSDPTIKIKLTQEKVVAKPTPSATPIATPSVTPSTAAPSKVGVKKISITCVKGKTKKVVTGTKPVCPAGYKKK